MGPLLLLLLKGYPGRYPYKFVPRSFLAKRLFLLAVPRGVEPPTFGLGNRCSILLSYGTIHLDYNGI
jgi:hypothetical protein